MALPHVKPIEIKQLNVSSSWFDRSYYIPFNTFPKTWKENNSKDTYKEWQVWDPSTHKSEKPNTNLVVIPLSALLLFVIMVCVKVSHWWNEDIRLTDGKMVNVYSPHKPPRHVLARVYSTAAEPRDETSLHLSIFSISNETNGLEPKKVLPSHNSFRFSETSLNESDYQEVVSTSNSSKLRRCPTSEKCVLNISQDKMNLASAKRPPGMKNPGLFRTHSSGCADHYVNTHQGVINPRFKRQLSSVSMQSSMTVQSESCSESVPLLVRKSSAERQSGVRQKQGHPLPTKVKRPSKMPPHLHRMSPLASRARSETNLGEDKEVLSVPEFPNLPPNISIRKLLKQSLNLNISLLTSMSPVTRLPPDGQGSGDDISGLHSPEGAASVNTPMSAGSRGPHTSSQYSSSADVTSSVSTGTSVTTLSSNVSSLNSSSSRPATPKKIYPEALYPAIIQMLIHNSMDNGAGQACSPSDSLSNAAVVGTVTEDRNSKQLGKGTLTTDLSPTKCGLLDACTRMLDLSPTDKRLMFDINKINTKQEQNPLAVFDIGATAADPDANPECPKPGKLIRKPSSLALDKKTSVRHSWAPGDKHSKLQQDARIFKHKEYEKHS